MDPESVHINSNVLLVRKLATICRFDGDIYCTRFVWPKQTVLSVVMHSATLGCWDVAASLVEGHLQIFGASVSGLNVNCKTQWKVLSLQFKRKYTRL